MGEKRKMTGRCLCGAVRITAAEVPVEFGACHCGMCRKWGGGGPLFAVHCSGEIAFDGAENIVRYHSSEWAERAFCKKCGTNLFYRLVDSDEHIFSVGIFDDQSAFTFASQIFIDEKPGYYDFANDTRKMTGADVFAQYAPPRDDAGD